MCPRWGRQALGQPEGFPAAGPAGTGSERAQCTPRPGCFQDRDGDVRSSRHQLITLREAKRSHSKCVNSKTNFQFHFSSSAKKLFISCFIIYTKPIQYLDTALRISMTLTILTIMLTAVMLRNILMENTFFQEHLMNRQLERKAFIRNRNLS